MGWWKRLTKGVQTATEEKMDTPDGVWWKCKACGTATHTKEIVDNLYVCTSCGYHSRIGSREYFDILFDTNRFKTLFDNLEPKDFLKFADLKPYPDRIKAAKAKTELNEAMCVGVGKVGGVKMVIACMDFSFIGGSMGSIVGEKISRSIDHCIENKLPFVIITKSGGARMQESAFSLMQMAKTSAKLTLLADAKLPYVALLTDPTTGGVSASFAMLGDVNIAEPNALIGFAGPRVIKETIKKDLPKGFQRSEFLLEHGFLDFIVERKDLKTKLSSVVSMMMNK